MALFVDLPAELLSRIASYLFSLDPASHGAFQDHGFCNLRLACQSLETKTRYSFERAAFSTVAVTLRATSLQRFLNISSQPHFGKLIKKIVFLKAHHVLFDKIITQPGFEGRHEYAGYGVIELPKEGDDRVYPNEGFTLRKRVRLGLQDILARAMSSTKHLQEIVIEPNFMASFWLDSPSRQQQLNEAAQRIYGITSTETTQEFARHVPIYDQESERDSDSELDILDGENQDYDNDEYDDPYHLETFVYPDYLLYLAAKAAYQQGLQLMSLSSSNAHASSIRARTLVELAPALERLQHLVVSISASSVNKLIRMNGSALHNHADGNPTAFSLSDALSTLRDLRSLDLTFDEHYWEDDRFSMVSKSLNALSQQSFVHLSRVDIRFACFEGKTLPHFLYNQRLVLQHLSLRRIVLPTIEHWRTIFGLLHREAPVLAMLCLSGLTGRERFEDAYERPNRAWESHSTMHCSGREEVMVELQRGLNYFAGAFR